MSAKGETWPWPPSSLRNGHASSPKSKCRSFCAASAARLDRAVDRPARRRPVHDRRRAQLRFGRLERDARRPDAARRAVARRTRLDARRERAAASGAARHAAPHLDPDGRRQAEPADRRLTAGGERAEPLGGSQDEPDHGAGHGRRVEHTHDKRSRRWGILGGWGTIGGFRAGGGGGPLRPRSHGRDGVCHHRALRRRVGAALGTGRQPLLRQVLPQPDLLAHGKFRDRPAAAGGLGRQAFLSARRDDRHLRRHLRRERVAHEELSRGGDGRAAHHRGRSRAGNLSPALAWRERLSD